MSIKVNTGPYPDRAPGRHRGPPAVVAPPPAAPRAGRYLCRSAPSSSLGHPPPSHHESLSHLTSHPVALACLCPAAPGPGASSSRPSRAAWSAGPLVCRYFFVSEKQRGPAHLFYTSALLTVVLCRGSLVGRAPRCYRTGRPVCLQTGPDDRTVCSSAGTRWPQVRALPPALSIRSVRCPGAPWPAGHGRNQPRPRTQAPAR